MTDHSQASIRQDAYFAMIPEWVLDAQFTPSAIVVYLNLARYANRRTRTCYPAKETIAERSGLSLNTVSRCLSELRDGGAITTKRRNIDGLPTSSVYTLHMVGPFGEKSNFGSDDDALIPNFEADIPEFEADIPDFGTQTRQSNQTRRTRQDISLSLSTFEQFWQAYPRHVAKGNARKAWEKATRKNDPQVIIEAAQRFAVSSAGSDPKFIKHPASWLNAECWTDEPDPEFLAPEQAKQRAIAEAIDRMTRKELGA